MPKFYKIWDEVVITSDRLAVSKYRHHKLRAIENNYSWEFTFTEWVAWWEKHLGKDWKKLRGRKKGQYVMARNGDKGGYSINNVRCVLAEDNCKERKETGVGKGTHNHTGEHNPKSKLTPEIVSKIKKSKARAPALAKVYGISRCTVNDIRAGRSWTHVK